MENNSGDELQHKNPTIQENCHLARYLIKELKHGIKNT